jgi:1-acyl-sn-glycerol-3-phosphate acyltransferase
MPRRNFRNLINANWYGRSPFWTWMFDRCGAIPIAPGDTMETCRRVIHALADGDAVCIFPEGRISRDGKLNRGRLGIGYMAAMSGAPVLPCGLRGNFEALPHHRRMPRRHPIRIRLGEPMIFPGSPTLQPDKYDVAVFLEGLMERIRILSGAEIQDPSRSAR